MNASITLAHYPPPPIPAPIPHTTTYTIYAPHPSHHHTTTHAIIAYGAHLDAPHANPWLITGIAPPRPPSPWAATRILSQDPTGTWTARAQTPSDAADSDSEVLVLDPDVLERDMATGRVGCCGARGCRAGVGCEACVGRGSAAGAKTKTKTSPRTLFRECVVLGEELVTPVAGAKEVFPMHLQRLATATVVVDVQADAGAGAAVQERCRTGPKIKYIRKRTLPLVVEKAGNKRRKTATGRYAK